MFQTVAVIVHDVKHACVSCGDGGGVGVSERKKVFHR